MTQINILQETNTNLRDLRTILFNLPKIDLHRHLEGSLRLSTLAEIARQHGVDLPSWDLEELRPYVQVMDDTPDFHGFLAKFKLLRRFYSSREAVMRVAYEAVADAAADNVRYLELRFNPVALSLNQGFSFEDVVDWVILATTQAQQDHPHSDSLDCANRSTRTPICSTTGRDCGRPARRGDCRVRFSRR